MSTMRQFKCLIDALEFSGCIADSLGRLSDFSRSTQAQVGQEKPSFTVSFKHARNKRGKVPY